MNFFRKLSINWSFPLCYNLLPHFTTAGQDYNNLANCAKDALQGGRIQTFFLSDRPLFKQEFLPSVWQRIFLQQAVNRLFPWP